MAKEPEVKEVEVEVLKPLHVKGKKTIPINSKIKMEESKAKTLAGLKKPAVKII